jgi:predicted RNase H-like HicB family nuclease
MKIKVVVHEAEEGGFWAEVPTIPGCATEGETMNELLRTCVRRSKAVFRLISPR